MKKKHKSGVRARRSPRRAKRKRATRRNSGGAVPIAQGLAKALERTDSEGARFLVAEIFRRRDPVTVAVCLLDCDRPTVVARVWERLLDYQFGRPAQIVEASGLGGGPIRIVWDVAAGQIAKTS